jgi:hypothetical protein
MPARVPQGVVEQVGEDALELDRVGAHEWQRGVDGHGERSWRRAELVDGGEDDVVDGAPLEPRVGGPGLEAREVEEVVDQAREAPAFLEDDRPELQTLFLAQLARRESACTRGDRGEGRAQVVGNRAQQGGLQDVRAAQRARFHRLAEQAVALECGGEQGLQGRHNTVTQPPEQFLWQPRGHDERAHPRRALTERKGDSALVHLHRSELDGRRRKAERAREPLRRHGKDLLQHASPEQQASHLCPKVGLPPSLLGLDGADASRLGERARAHGDDDEDGQRDPVLAITDREAPGDREVREVEGRRARDRGEHSERRAPDRRHEQHADEVYDAQRDHGGHRLEGIEEERGKGHRAECHANAGGNGRWRGGEKGRRCAWHRPQA